MSSNTCNFDDASLLADGLAMMETAESDSIVVVEEEDEEEGSLEGVGKMQQTFDSMMCDTPSALEHGVCHPTTVPGIIETTESDFIVVFEEDKQEKEEEEERPKVTETDSSNDGQNPGEEGSKAEEKEDEYLEGAEKLIQDLFCSDNAKGDAVLDALFLGLDMSSKDAIPHKRKPPQNVDPVSGTDEHSPKKIKTRKVSTDASPLTSASLQVDTLVVTERSATANTASAAIEDEGCIQGIGALIQDLFGFDNPKVNAALDALDLDLNKDKNKCENLVTAGGCLALVQLLNTYLDKAIDSIPACDQVAKLNELAELTSLHKTLKVITNFTFLHDESQVRITAVGGVEAVVKIMKTFPKCQALQERACGALNNLVYRNATGTKQVIESGGCDVLVQLMNNCLDIAIDRIPACDQVRQLNELTELTTLHKTLDVIISLTLLHDESRVGITAVGGVEAVVKVMKTFPKCQIVQRRACCALLNLACCSIGKANAIESGGIEVILAAVNNHLDSAIICEYACWALVNIVKYGSKENTGLLITLGAGVAVTKVRTKWTDNEKVQKQVRKLVKRFAAEWKAWDDEDEK